MPACRTITIGVRLLISVAVSIGRCNTRRKSQVQDFQRLRIIREHKSEEKASCLGKSELQPRGSVRSKRIARSNDHKGVASTVWTGTDYWKLTATWQRPITHSKRLRCIMVGWQLRKISNG